MVARMVDARDLRPDSFINPSLPLYASVPFVFVQQRLAAAGVLPGRAADPLWILRVLSALAGAAAVVVLGRSVRAVHPRLGPWPALLLALGPGFVNLCHFATPEPWLMLGTIATLATALAYRSGRARAWHVGLALGLTASTKFTAAALIVPVLVAVCGEPSRRDRAASAWRESAFAVVSGVALGAGLWLSHAGPELAPRLHLADARMLQLAYAVAFLRKLARTLTAAGALGLALSVLARRGVDWAARVARADVAVVAAAAVGGFVLGSPYAVLDPMSFLSGLAFNDQTRFEYKGLTGAATSFGPYVSLLADALTWPLLAAVLLGLAVCVGRVLRRDLVAAVLAAGVVSPYLLVAAGGHQAMRFLAPVLPAAAWVAAIGLAALPRPIAPAARLLVAARAGLAALLLVRLFFVDARALATRWLADHVPPGSTVDVIANAAGYAPTAPPGLTLRPVPTLSREMAPADRFVEAARRYPAEGADWVVLSASYYERFLEHPEQRPERAAFFGDLLGGRLGYVEAARFRQRGWLRPPAEFVDPEIVVLRRSGG